MSFRVNTNVTAMNALRNLGTTNTEFSQSISRLSTGLRINQAADDPAGLIISETFRAQISGLEQAMKNSQDAINYAKTAEGALDEVNRLLRDARSLAVASGNTGALTEAQVQANQSQLNSIVNSITRIAQQTQFGTKKLLDGSAGVYASVTSGANIAAMTFTGTFNGASLTTNSIVTIDMVTSAERASITGSRTFALATTTVAAGSFTINGRTFNTASTDTIADVVARINNASDSTGVTANWTAGQGVVLTSREYGLQAKVDLADTSGILLSAAGTLSDLGVDAVADIALDTNGTDAGGLVTVTFDKGAGLTLRDNYGNALTLTENGNLNMAATSVGQINVGASQFQIGANAGQTVNLSLGSFAAEELGKGIVSGKNLSNLDLTNASGATDALKVIDKAISDVATSRGQIGSFHRNILESNIRSLGVAKENLSATESTIRDTDIAMEMTNYTKLQILQQSGLSVLAQANAAPQAVLSLLRG
ncbi:MAG TPA: flagellin [Fimbriimonadaceae bacterium]|nr:flagellin [Fimbriimonadaceae bacterium]